MCAARCVGGGMLEIVFAYAISEPDTARGPRIVIASDESSDARAYAATSSRHAGQPSTWRSKPSRDGAPEPSANASASMSASIHPTAASILALAMTASDLELAAACARGEDAALAELEERHWPEMKRALARLRLGDAAIDEILQRVRTKLFVGEPPRIATYGGKGPLAGWLRAIAVHEALSDKRAEKRRPEDGVSAIERMAVPEQPEIAALRAQYAAPFEAAFGEALGSLDRKSVV